MKKILFFTTALLLLYCKTGVKKPTGQTREVETKKEESVTFYQAPEKENEIYYFIRSGNLEKLKELIEEKKENLNQQNDFQQTPFHVAILSNHQHIIEYLLPKIENFDAVDAFGNTYLHYAVYKQNTQLVSLLVDEKNVNLSIANNQNLTAFDVAVEYSSRKIADIIFSRILSNRIEETLAKDKNKKRVKSFPGVEEMRNISEEIIWSYFENTLEEKKRGGIYYFLSYPEIQQVFVSPENEINRKKINFLIEKLNESLAEKNVEISVLLLKKLNRHFFEQEFSKQKPGDVYKKYAFLLEWAIASSDSDLLNLLISYGFDINTPIEIENKTTYPMLYAIEKNFYEGVNILIHNGANVLARDEDGNTGMHLAARTGNLQIIDLLLKSGYKTDILNNQKQNPVHIASIHGQHEVIPVLHRHKIPVNTLDAGNLAPIHYAIMNGNLGVVRTLIDLGIDVNQEFRGKTLLRWAAEKNHRDIVKLLIEKGADINKIEEGNWSILRWATEEVNDKEIVLLLLEKNVDDKIEFKNKNKLLHWAAKNGYLEIVQNLIKKRNHDVNEPNLDGDTPLHLSLEYYHFDVARYFIENGASVNAGNKENITPLHLVALLDNSELAIMMLKKGANINSQTKQKNTPLLLASFSGSVNVAKILIDNGADETLANEDGWTPFHWACFNGVYEVAEYILKKSKKKDELINMGVTLKYFDSKDKKNSWTPLHLAAYGNHTNIVKLLLQHKANVNIKDSSGMNPMHIAASRGNQDIVRILKEAGAEN